MEEPDCNDAKSKQEELIEKIKSGEKIPISSQILIKNKPNLSFGTSGSTGLEIRVMFHWLTSFLLVLGPGGGL